MADNTINLQGRFTSTGATQRLVVRSDVDWIEVRNETAIIQTTADLGAKFYFQRGMTAGRGEVETKLGTVVNDPMSAGQIAADAGFTLVDTSANPLSAAIAVTAGTDSTTPTFSTADTSDLASGDVVRLSSLTGQENLAGIDFQVSTVVSDTSFLVAYAIATTPGAASTAGNWRKVKYDPIFYPRRRFIANITAAGSAVVTCTADHGLTVGQEVRIIVPAEYGMTEMNALSGTITAQASNSLTIDVDSSAFTAFQFPLPGVVPFSPALVIPFGMDTAEALSAAVDDLADETENLAVIGVDLAAGTLSPAGQTSDVIYWRAGKSFSIDNQ